MQIAWRAYSELVSAYLHRVLYIVATVKLEEFFGSTGYAFWSHFPTSETVERRRKEAWTRHQVFTLQAGFRSFFYWEARSMSFSTTHYILFMTIA